MNRRAFFRTAGLVAALPTAAVVKAAVDTMTPPAPLEHFHVGETNYVEKMNAMVDRVNGSIADAVVPRYVARPHSYRNEASKRGAFYR